MTSLQMSTLGVVRMANEVNDEGKFFSSEISTKKYSNFNNQLKTANYIEDNPVNDFPREKSTVLQEFYNGKSIFLTGVTGFLGKYLLYKLLRWCPMIKNIYVLVRQKRGKDVHSRLEQIFDDHLFASLKEQFPKFRQKVKMVSGDLEIVDLGISQSDRKMLMENVDIVIHGAATVKFDEKIRLAMAINVNGVVALLDLCRSMKKLQVVVHVSTAYSNCFVSEIDERFYEHTCKVHELNKLLEKLDDKAIEKMLPKILGKWPNTYTFTKAMAEDYIREHCNDLPIGIFRPGIVTSTYKDPVTGWTDNMHGAVGIVTKIGMGELRTLHCNGDIIANLVPVDYCANALLASAWDIALNCKYRKADNMLIYNYVISEENELTWQDFYSLIEHYGFKNPFAKPKWYYVIILDKSAFMNKIHKIFFHYVPAILVDVVSLCIGRKARILELYKKVHKAADVVSYFITHDWIYQQNNVKILWDKLNEEDKKIFPFNMNAVDWIYYCTNFVDGIRKYLFKETANVADARKRWTRLYYLHRLLKVIFATSFSLISWFSASYLLNLLQPH